MANMSIGIHASNKGPCTSAKQGKPYSPDMCLICWLALNDPDFSYLNTFLEIQPEISAKYLQNSLEQHTINEFLASKQKKEDDVPLWRKIGNFTTATIDWLTSGAKFVPDNIKQIRKYICEHCTQYAKSGVCNHTSCGCQIDYKISMNSSECPIGKWSAYKEVPNLNENSSSSDWYKFLKDNVYPTFETMSADQLANFKTCQQAHVQILEEYKNYFQQNYNKLVNDIVDDIVLIICGGGATYFQLSWQLIKYVRKHGWTAGIEFWYLGEAEMDDFTLELLQNEKVTVIDASTFPNPVKKPRILHGWELKAFSILNTKKRFILFLDADVLPVQKNLMSLFDHPSFYETGATFWQDPSFSQISNLALWSCGLPPQNVPDCESGILLIDKKHSLIPLGVVFGINNHSDYYYRFFVGDKTTFPLGFLFCNSPFTFMPNHYTKVEHPFDNSPIYYHNDYNNNLLIQHFVLGSKKFLLDGSNLEHFSGGKEYKNYIELLKTKYKWDGKLYSWSRMKPDEKYMAERLIPGKYLLQEHNIHKINVNRRPFGRIIELLPNGTVADHSLNSNKNIISWSFRIKNNSPQIILFANNNGNKPFNSVFAFLSEKVKGVWVGNVCLTNTFDNYPISLERMN